jgi:hypothetical protein
LQTRPADEVFDADLDRGMLYPMLPKLAVCQRSTLYCAALLLSLLSNALWAQAPPSIVGTWRVVAFETHNSDGSVIKEFGEKPLGYFIYDATGHVAIQMTENPAKKDPARAFAYFGTYQVDAARGIVIHHVEGAVEGNGGAGPKVREYIGKDELRPFRLEGDHLIIEIRKGNNLGLALDEGVEYKVREMVRVR